MAQRSLGSRLVVGSALWTIGLLSLAVLIAMVVINHAPHAAWEVHWTIIGFTAAILMVVGFTQLRRSLSPFDELRRRLRAVRAGEAPRVDGTYPLEVQPVIDDLNALLEHQASAVARAQARAGDLAHGLKTPLAVLAQEAGRASEAGQHALAETIQQQVSRMERQITYQLAQARAGASGATLNARADVLSAAEGLARTLRRLYAERQLRVEVSVDRGLVVRVERADLEEMLGNLLDNGCKWARSQVTVSSAAAGAMVLIEVDDDGPGIEPALREAVLGRGVRADQVHPGSGLGLAIVRDLAELYGGSITIGLSPLGGAQARLSLPSVTPG